MMLWLHIGGGIATLLIVSAVAWNVIRSKSTPWLRKSLPLLAVWQTATGALLVVMGGSFLRVCGMGVVYLSILAVVYVWSERKEQSLAVETVDS